MLKPFLVRSEVMARGRKSAAEVETRTLRLASSTDRPLTPPAILTAEERDLFDQLRTANRHLTATDIPMLTAYVQSISQAHRLGKGKGKVSDWERATRVMMALGTKLKLTPQADRRVDRGGIGVRGVPWQDANSNIPPWSDDKQEEIDAEE
jgi:hypothetical protein